MLLQAVDLGFSYDGPLVVDGVSLAIDRGMAVGILGPNGSGKTTLLRLIAGALVPQTGRIAFDGRPMEEFSRRAIARRLAVVPQETELAFDYSVLEVVLMGRYPHSRSRDRTTSRRHMRRWTPRARARSRIARFAR